MGPAREHEFEPVRGLPERLPDGETLLWQGSPSWTRLACEAFHIRAVAAYFALMLGWRVAAAVRGGSEPLAALGSALSVTPVALAALGLLALLAWLNAKTTIYTITSRRIVLRIGVALTKAFNIPFAIVESGALKSFSDGSGDLAVTLKAPNKLAFLHLWPHTRPWRPNTPQPTLRAIPDAAAVARILASAMDAQVGVALAPVAVAAPAAATGKPRLGRPQTAVA